MVNYPKSLRKRIVRALLQPIILKSLEQKPKSGYGIILFVRREYGVYFGPSTVYPLMVSMEENRLLSSEWILSSPHAQKRYQLTSEGQKKLAQSHAEALTIISTFQNI